MKKIGIITIEGNKNYGNKLQNYALQTILEKQGFITSTIFQKNKTIKKILSKTKRIIYFVFRPNSNIAKEHKREKA